MRKISVSGIDDVDVVDVIDSDAVFSLHITLFRVVLSEHGVRRSNAEYQYQQTNGFVNHALSSPLESYPGLIERL